MKVVVLVTEEEADLARSMEKRLLALPESSGVLFAGVSIRPATDYMPSHYSVWVGCHRDFSEGIVEPLVRATLSEEIRRGVAITVEAHRGISRPATK
jgi:hypothetical protein